MSLSRNRLTLNTAARFASVLPRRYSTSDLQHSFLVEYTPCLKKNDNDVAHYNFNAH